MDSSKLDWFEALLLCVECGAPSLLKEESHYSCPACSAQFSIANGVPLLLKPSSFTDASVVIGRHLGGLSPDDVTRVFGTALQYRLKDVNIRTEFTNIVERYDALFPDVERESQPATSELVTLVAHYFNPNFTAGETCYRSFRLRNNSGTIWSSKGPQPHNLSYFLYAQAAPETPIEGIRSALPVPLRPTYELTVPLRIVVPQKAGRYRIVVKLVQEFVGWFEKPIFEGEFIVRDSAGAVPRPGLVTPAHEGFFDFEGDLRQCGAVLRRAVSMLRERGKDQPLRVLEVASGNDPQVLRHYQSDTLVVATDVAFPQAQFGALQYSRSATIDPNLYRFVTADVFASPFKPHVFDLIVVCAALHHFTNTTEALKTLSQLLRPDGLVVLLREPCKMFPEDETYIKELLNGFNEQQFELDEYDEMFRGSDFRPLYEQVDYECSYKSILGSIFSPTEARP